MYDVKWQPCHSYHNVGPTHLRRFSLNVRAIKLPPVYPLQAAVNKGPLTITSLITVHAIQFHKLVLILLITGHTKNVVQLMGIEVCSRQQFGDHCCIDHFKIIGKVHMTNNYYYILFR